MNFFRNVLIHKPMKTLFNLTMLLNCIVFVLLNKVLRFYEVSNIEYVIILGLYISVVLLFIYFNSKNDRNLKLGTIREQLRNNFEGFSIKSFFNCTICIVNFIFNIIIVELYIKNNLNSNIPSFIVIIFYVLSSIILVMRLLYILIGISPFIVVTLVSMFFLITPLIGLNDALLSWTFIMLILGTLYPQFTNIDIKYLLSKEDRDRVINNNVVEEKIKEELNRDKYSLLAYIPVLYISLLITEIITKDKMFIHFVNIITFSHYESFTRSYFTFYSFYSNVFKVIIIVMFYGLYSVHKDKILEYLTRKKLDISKKLETPFTWKGRYYKTELITNKQKELKKNKKWEIVKSHYIDVENNKIIEKKLNEENNSEESRDITEQGDLNKNLESIHYISNDILKVRDDYFILETSEKIKEINGVDKYTGERILKMIDYSFIRACLLICVSFPVLSVFISHDMETKYRGIYNLESENNEIKTDTLYFVEDRITNVKQNILYYNSSRSLSKTYTKITRYKYDNVGLIIKDMNGNKVGQIDLPSRDIVIEDNKGNTKKYIFDKIE